MKASRLISLVLVSSLGLALAANATAPVPINATVNNSCEVFGGTAMVFGESVQTYSTSPVITIPTYEASDLNPAPGQTNIAVKCNRGTQPVTTYWQADPFFDVDLTATNGDKLTVTLGYGASDPVFGDPPAGATSDGGDLWVYTVTATPKPGQWGASSSTTYTGTQLYLIGF